MPYARTVSPVPMVRGQAAILALLLVTVTALGGAMGGVRDCNRGRIWGVCYSGGSTAVISAEREVFSHPTETVLT
jgi:hypothetical protein